MCYNEHAVFLNYDRRNKHEKENFCHFNVICYGSDDDAAVGVCQSSKQGY